MLILTYFVDSGVPKTGLSPTIRIRDLSDNSLVITDGTMVEVGDGLYKYDFEDYDDTVDYAIRCDGTATLSDSDRYAFASNEVDTALTTYDAATGTELGIVSAKVDTAQDDLDTMLRVLIGKWAIVGTQLIMYEADGETALYTFDLKNIAGNAASTRIFSREPV